MFRAGEAVEPPALRLLNTAAVASAEQQSRTTSSSAPEAAAGRLAPVDRNTRAMAFCPALSRAESHPQQRKAGVRHKHRFSNRPMRLRFSQDSPSTCLWISAMVEFQENISLDLDGRSLRLAEDDSNLFVVKANSGINIIDRETLSLKSYLGFQHKSCSKLRQWRCCIEPFEWHLWG